MVVRFHSNIERAELNIWGINNYYDLINSEEVQRENSPTERAARFDQRLLEELYERLATRRDIETHDLRLQAHSGTVMLEGSVGARPMKTYIENVVTACPYVKSVVNHLEVRGNLSATPVIDDTSSSAVSRE